VLVLAAVALVACGGSSNNEEGGGETAGGESGAAAKEAGGGEEAGGGGEEAAGGAGGTLKFETDPNGALEYTTSKASTKAGDVTVDFNNPQPLEHDVAFEDSSGETVGKTELVAEGTTSTSVELKPGTYTFYCTVPGHREAGMEGTLVVK
jgi:plastocyanin